MKRAILSITMLSSLLFSSLLFSISPALAVSGDDTSPGDACSNENAVRMTANPTGSGGYILTCEGGVWGATISGATPTVNEHLATKEYVDAAAGGGEAVYQCKVTSTSYNGNLGGRTGADAKCAADLGAGYYFASSYYYYTSVAANVDTSGTAFSPWLDTAGSGDCGNWTSSAATSSNAGWYSATSMSGLVDFWKLQGNGGTTSCSSSKKLTCCNIPRN